MSTAPETRTPLEQFRTREGDLRSSRLAASASPSRPSSPSDAPLTRAEAEAAAWRLYASDEPAVVELLLLATNTAAPSTRRVAAWLALDWFDPAVSVPAARRPEEDVAVCLVRWLGLGRDLQTRQRAAHDLVRLLGVAS